MTTRTLLCALAAGALLPAAGAPPTSAAEPPSPAPVASPAPGLGAPQGPDLGGPQGPGALPVFTQGFDALGVVPGAGLALTSPAPGELWIASRGPRGRLVLTHRVGQDSRTQSLPVAAGGRTELSSSGPANVWLATGGQAWHLVGGSWRRERVAVAGVEALNVRSVRATGARDALLGVTSTRLPGGGAVLARGGGRYRSLGAPAAGTTGASASPEEIRVADGLVHTRWRMTTATGSSEAVWVHRNGWSRQFTIAGSDAHRRHEVTAWVLRGTTRQMAFGTTTDAQADNAPLCRRYSAPRPVEACTTVDGVGGAALLADGAIVLGGVNGTRPDEHRGGFTLRYPWGAEKVLLGDPGDGTIALEAEPGTNVAWALTASGGVTYLQRYESAKTWR